jgi:hypothetical protein
MLKRLIAASLISFLLAVFLGVFVHYALAIAFGGALISIIIGYLLKLTA